MLVKVGILLLCAVYYIYGFPRPVNEEERLLKKFLPFCNTTQDVPMNETRCVEPENMEDVVDVRIIVAECICPGKSKCYERDVIVGGKKIFTYTCISKKTLDKFKQLKQNFTESFYGPIEEE